MWMATLEKKIWSWEFGHWVSGVRGPEVGFSAGAPNSFNDGFFAELIKMRYYYSGGGRRARDD